MPGCVMEGICNFRSQCDTAGCPYVAAQREEMESWCFENGLLGNCDPGCVNYGTEFCTLEEEE